MAKRTKREKEVKTTTVADYQESLSDRINKLELNLGNLAIGTANITRRIDRLVDAISKSKRTKGL